MPTILVRLPSRNGPTKLSGPKFTDCRAGGGTCLYLKEESCFDYNQSGQGEGNGTPLQYSCLETPMDRGAW